ncbi:MAG TPA: BON domain-containing protein [Pedobacter sp.]|nr:BON domain-containing protein [Pedobacter sp.]
MEALKYLRGTILVIYLATTGCNQQMRDQEIKADITTKAKEDINFAGVQFTVQNGIVTLLGSAPTLKSREMLKQKVSSIHVIDSIDDRLQIAPVSIGANFTLKQQIDSVLVSYPMVIAAVSDNSAALIGSVSRKKRSKLLEQVGKLVGHTTTNRLATIE